MSEQQEEQSPEDDIYAKARVIYEGTHGLTMRDLSEMTGIPPKELARVKHSQGWRKNQSTKHGGASPIAIKSAEELHAAAARQVETQPPQVTEEQVQSLAGQVMPDHTSEVLDRHLKELAIVRALIVEGVKLRDSNPIKAFDRARLAKAVGDTLQVVHDGERRALGITANDKALKAPPQTAGYVVLERTAGVEGDQ